MRTLYEAVGGEPAVRAILQALYDKLFCDPMVGFLFEGKDKAHIVEQQLSFTCRFLGGPQRYEGKPLPEAHARLPLLPGHFDRRHFLLAQTLDERRVPEDAKRMWLSIDESLRSSVLGAGDEAREKTRMPG
jgi:hemoglobin